MKSIREVLSPLLIISYVCGLRLWNIELPIIGLLKPWFSVSYMLLLWLIYFFFLKFAIISFSVGTYIEYLIFLWEQIVITLLSIVFGMYHNKKFINCLKKLDIIDDTLLKIGITTDYHELHKRSVCLVLGWFIIVILLNNGIALCMNIQFNVSNLMAMYIIFIRNYCSFINFINDLIIASIFGYIRLKFDQVNEYILNLSRDDECENKWALQNSVLYSHRHRFPKVPSIKWTIWILIHLDLELRRISYEINSIFGILMTLKMGYYLLCLVIDLNDIFIATYDFFDYDRTLCYIVGIFGISLDIFIIFLYNYMCETVSAKAIATGNLINRMPYFTFNVEIRENILQLLLQIAQMPVRFYGIGLFQFGYKFLLELCSSITTALVLMIQRHVIDQVAVSLDIL